MLWALLGTRSNATGFPALVPAYKSTLRQKALSLQSFRAWLFAVNNPQ